MSYQDFKKWLDEDEDEEEEQQSQQVSSSGGFESFKRFIENREEVRGREPEETGKPEEREEEPSGKNLWQRAKETVKKIFPPSKEVETPPEKIKSVYTSRTSEAVKHSAEIEIAEIDQKIAKMEADRETLLYVTQGGTAKVAVKSILGSASAEDTQKLQEKQRQANEIAKSYKGEDKEYGYADLNGIAMELESDIESLKRSREQLEMVVKNQEAGPSNKFTDFVKEIIPGLKSPTTLPIIGDLVSLAYRIEEDKVSEKREKGEKLTPSEEVIYKRIKAREEYEKRNISVLQEFGQAIPETLSLMAEMYVGMGKPTAGLKGVPAVLDMSKRATRASFTAHLPSLFDEFANRVFDQYETVPTQGGGFELVKMKEGDVPTTAAISAIAQVWANDQVEAVGGELVDSALGFLFKPLGKILTKVPKVEGLESSKAFQAIKKLYKSEALSEFFARQSPVGEVAEEFMGLQVDKLTNGEPLGITAEEAKRITSVSLMMSLLFAPMGLMDLPNGQSKKITEEDLDKLPSGLKEEVKEEIAGKDVIDKEDMREISANIVDKLESGEIKVEVPEEEVNIEKAPAKTKQEVKTEEETITKEASSKMVWESGAEEVATIPDEPMDFLLDHKGQDWSEAKATISFDVDNDTQEDLGYKITLKDGTVVNNPEAGKLGGSPYFKTLKEAEAYAEKVVVQQQEEEKLKKQGWIPIENARKFQIGDLTFYSHKNDSGGYTITEATSGFSVARGDTLKEAKANAETTIKRYGIKRTKELIADKISQYGQSPDGKAYMRVKTEQDLRQMTKETEKEVKPKTQKEKVKEAVKAGRNAVAIEKNKEVVEKKIVPRVKEAIKETKYSFEEWAKTQKNLPSNLEEPPYSFEEWFKKYQIPDRDVDPRIEYDAYVASLEEEGYEVFGNADYGIKVRKVGEEKEYEAIKQKMKKRLTPEEAVEAQRIVDEELKASGLASVDVSQKEDIQFLNSLKNFRSQGATKEKADAINTALEEYSPTIAPNYKFTKEKVEERNKRISTLPALELPEIVNIVNSLSDKELLTIVKKFRGSTSKRGMFRYKDQEATSIDVLAALFSDPEVASKTIAHEIGHFVDFLPDNRMAGTFASKIAGLKSMAKNFGEFKDSVMREEIYALSKDVWRPYSEEAAEESYIRYRKSAEELYADFISMLFIDPGLLKKEAPHTLSAWISYLENKPEAKKVFEEAWDLMLKTGDELYDQRSKNIREMFHTGDEKLWGVGEAAELNERKRASFYLISAWKGIGTAVNEVRTHFEDIKTPLRVIEKKAQKELGRKLSIEERISKQVESLQKISAQEQAYIDTYYDPIKRRLDAEGLSWELLGEYQFLNRIVKERGDLTPQEAYDALEDVSLLDIFTENDKEIDINFKKVLANVKEDVMLTDFIEESIEKGKSISEVIGDLRNGIYKTLFGEKGPRTKSEVYVQKILENGGLAKRLSTYLPMKLGIANPLGFTTETAAAQIDYIKRQLGDEKFELLKQIAEKDFRAGSLALLELKGAKNYFGENKIQKIKENEAYVTFAVNHYLEKYIPVQIRRQVGTLKGVANVATATALKNTSLLRAIEQNEVRLNAVKFLEKWEPDAIKKAPMRFDFSRGYQVLDEGKASRMKGWEVFYFMENGKARQVMLREDVFNAITERIADGNTLGLKVLNFVNSKFYRPIFVVYNAAFGVYNVQRDFLRTWRNNPWTTLPELLYSYTKALPQTAKSVFKREDSELIREMKNKRMLGFYRDDVYGNSSSVTSAKLFELYQTKAGETKAKTALERGQRLLDTISKFNQMFEMLPKVAVKMIIDNKQVFKTDAEVRDFIVNYVGSPNFQNKGQYYRYYNNIFPFSNAVKEGWKGDLEVLTGKGTAGAKGGIVATLRILEMTVLPTAISYMVRAGLPPFDDDDEWGDLRKLLERIPRRDFVSFLPLPVGEWKGKTIYVPLARAETDQLIAQVTWALMDGITDVKGENPLQTIADALISEFPSINPLFTTMGAIVKTASGENPYDSFRGRYVFDPYTFETMTGKEKTLGLIEYLAGVNGMNVIFRSYDPRKYGEESSPLQKAHQVPFVGNVIYRLIRESNYGIIETAYREKVASEKEQVQLKKERDRMMAEDAKVLIEKNASVKELESKLQEYQEVAIGRSKPPQGYTEEEKIIANNVRKSFKKALLKESGKTPSWRVINANTNNEKKKILLIEKENLSEEEFTNYLRNLRNYEIISDEFVKDLRKEGYIKQSQYQKIILGDRFKFHPIY